MIHDILAATWAAGMDQSQYNDYPQNEECIMLQSTTEDHTNLQTVLGDDVVPSGAHFPQSVPNNYSTPPPDWRYRPQMVDKFFELQHFLVECRNAIFSFPDEWHNLSTSGPPSNVEYEFHSSSSVWFTTNDTAGNARISVRSKFFKRNFPYSNNISCIKLVLFYCHLV